MRYLSVFLNWFFPNFFAFLWDTIYAPISYLKFLIYKTQYKQKIILDEKFDENNNIAIICGFNEHITISLKNLIEGLVKNSIKVFYISNKNIDKEFEEYLKSKCNIIMIRSNFGADIGAYKYGLDYLFKNKIKFENLYVINDSLIYHSSIKYLFRYLNKKNNKIIGLFENYFMHYHIQSFFFKLSYDVALDLRNNFFLNYKCFNHRKHTINHGEVGISTYLKKYYSKDIRVIYDINYLRKNFSRINKDPVKQNDLYQYLFLLAHVVLRTEGILKIDKDNPEFNIASFLENLENCSNVHYGIAPLAHKIKMFKKDMALRAKFPMSYVLQIFQSKWKLDPDFNDEINVTIREKANASSFSNNPFKYFLFKIGRI
jgi:hypothetical protein